MSAATDNFSQFQAKSYPGPVVPVDARRAEKLAAFDRLLTIMDQLRLHCPWDKKQSFESLRHLTIEETFELSDAILSQEWDEVSKELGDLMLHLAFYARLGDEMGSFDMGTVLDNIAEKLIRRHPHIYADTSASNEDDVKRNWELIKQAESKGEKSVLEGVPRSLPPLIKAMRIQEKARGAGFDWEEPHQVWDKVQEELSELKQAAEAGQQEEVQKEFGDLLFSLVNYARFVGVNPDESLEMTNRKFINRFQYLEQAVKANGQILTDLSLAEMDRFWDEAKAKGL